MLSALIIARNEEAVIGRCLDSLTWADEIVVIDSNSNDRTVEICRSKGAQVYSVDWQGFGKQRNTGISRCTGDWILAVDADESISPDLRDEIRKVIADAEDIVAFEVPRLSSYCGRTIRHGAWWPDHVLRLFRKSSGQFSEVAVHERFVTSGPIGHLQHCIYHEAYKNLDEVLVKLNIYSSLSARQMREAGRTASLLKAVGHGLWAFFRNYIVLAGFRDGAEGFMLAISNAEHAYYKYAKLYLLGKNGPEPRADSSDIDV